MINIKLIWVSLWFIQAIGGSYYFGINYFLGFVFTTITYRGLMHACKEERKEVKNEFK